MQRSGGAGFAALDAWYALRRVRLRVARRAAPQAVRLGSDAVAASPSPDGKDAYQAERLALNATKSTQGGGGNGGGDSSGATSKGKGKVKRRKIYLTDMPVLRVSKKYPNGRYENADRDKQAQFDQRHAEGLVRLAERNAGKATLLQQRRGELSRLLHPAASSSLISQTRSTLEAQAADIVKRCDHRELAELLAGVTANSLGQLDHSECAHWTRQSSPRSFDWAGIYYLLWVGKQVGLNSDLMTIVLKNFPAATRPWVAYASFEYDCESGWEYSNQRIASSNTPTAEMPLVYFSARPSVDGLAPSGRKHQVAYVDGPIDEWGLGAEEDEADEEEALPFEYWVRIELESSAYCCVCVCAVIFFIQHPKEGLTTLPPRPIPSLHHSTPLHTHTHTPHMVRNPRTNNW